MSNGLSINSNVAALHIQSRLLKSQAQLGQTYNRLASGMRVNSAKDDAAGYANIQRMTTQVRGLEQAKRNSQDALGMMNIAGGGLEEITDALQRIKELAADAANGTRSQADRRSIDLEVQQLIDQIDTIADTTKFGNTHLLNGTLGSVTIQTGANAGESVDVMGVDARAQTLGDVAMKLSGGNMGKAVSGSDNSIVGQTLTIEGEKIGIHGNEEISSIVSKINSLSGKNSVSASATTEAIITVGNLVPTSGTPATANASASFKINGQSITYSIAKDDTTEVVQDKIVKAINNSQNSSTKGVQASFNSSGQLVLSNETGANIEFGEVFSNGTTGATGVGVVGPEGVTSTTAGAATIAVSDTTSSVVTGSLSLASIDPLKSTIDASSSLGASDPTALVQGGDTSETRTVIGSDVTTAANAKDLMKVVDGALEQITAHQARLGSLSNRFESVVNNLTTQSTNIQGARSRIQDADVAAESSRLARLSTLQQSATAMLAQANQMPAQALNLLR